MLVEEDVKDFLEHFGIRGMHWGVRNPKNRQLNKQSRQKDRKKHEAQVLNARKQFQTTSFFKNDSQARKDYLKAKAKFKKDREVIGSREARKIFNKTKQKNINNYYKSQEAANGKEVAAALIISVGAMVAGAAIQAAGKRSLG